VDWWFRSHKTPPKGRRKAFDSLIFLVARGLWTQRNSRVFNNVAMMAAALVDHVRMLGDQWCSARLIHRSMLSGV
jgi:hypothetical protein